VAVITLEWVDRPDGDVLAAARALASAVEGADGTSAFAEPARHDLAGTSSFRTTSRLLVGRTDDAAELAAVALVDAERPDDVVVELAVHPEGRLAGVGATVVEALVAALPSARAWAHGDHPGAARLAERAGRRRVRELWRMRRPGPGHEALPLPALEVPDGVAIRPLRVDEDEDAVVAVNNRAFAWHPEQSGWTREDVTGIEAEPWFDAAGVLLAWDTASEALLGFHFTKVHERSPSVPDPLGEVYVVGVDPDAQGRGLGRALTLAGLHHLAGRGLRTVILYVEGDNAAAVATYRRLGFERDAVDVSYQP
jgi:mycothiol synthase